MQKNEWKRKRGGGGVGGVEEERMKKDLERKEGFKIDYLEDRK